MKNDSSDSTPQLNLPVIKDGLPGSPILDMDAYLEFVEFGWAHTIDHEAVEEQKKKQRVTVPFRIQD